ncbi:EAL domain-containing protein [Exilibacterium tricleocarpae]|uniref:EAL domain-containing protein n=1 Tax=Exilibacterium tricleocarpae TaxID=2591008 RepID=A0A545T0L2_9GAMM|nr:EAL domain-containing protein [Exilibacterium tricleocarpae]TQV70755.1 EAL domain-containing protein [Exilibacterium tricleocarpae]
MDTTIKILFINNEHAEYLLVGDLLRQVRHTDYRLTWCDRLEYAMDELMTDQYDVVLLDYHWGNGNGRDLLEGARTMGCQVPILVMTDEMEAELDRQIIRTGASDYLVKGSIDSQLLERTLRYAIERKAAELKLARLAHYDILTNVPNRILFRDRLEHALQLAERGQRPFTLMYMDLDDFKLVNDSYGHDVGDALIRACAERLSTCMRKSDSVARIGGDEFTILLEATASTTSIVHIAQKIVTEITRPYYLSGQQVTIGCSLGIAVYPDAGRDADTLQKHADMAMYQAKQEEGSTYRFFTEVMNEQARRQLVLEGELRQALSEGEFVLHYQPRIDIGSGNMVALEALIRWCHPQRGLLMPEAFLATAESSGLIVDIGYWVVQQACEDLRRLRALQSPALNVAVNLSLRQFTDNSLVTRIAGILAETGVDSRHLEFELTETTVMANLDRVSLCIRALAQMGVNFALDDFGTGVSSFVHLQRIPLSTLKIDRQFIDNIDSNANDRRLVRSMIAFAHSMEKNVVAVGVESKAQLSFLRQCRCDQVQGFHLCEPVAFDELDRVLALRASG